MPYSDKVLDHYSNPRNVGSFDAADHDGLRAVIAAEPAEVTPDVLFDVRPNPSFPVFGGKDDVNADAGVSVGHGAAGWLGEAGSRHGAVASCYCGVATRHGCSCHPPLFPAAEHIGDRGAPLGVWHF